MQESYLIPTVGSNASLWREHGQPTVVSSSNTQVSTTAGEKIELEGNDDTLIGSGYAIAAQENLTVTLGGAGVSSAAIGFLGSLDTINVAQGANLRVQGDHDTITSQGSLNLVVSGSNDTVNAMSGDVIALHRGSDDTIDGVGMTVDANWARSLVLAGGDPGAVDLDGYGNGVTIAGAVDVNLQGSCNVVAATADDVITLGAGHRNLFTGGEFSIDAASGDSFSVRSVLQTSAADSGLITVAGSGFSLAIAGASNVTLSGSDDAVAVGTDAVVDLTGGAGDTFLGAGFTLDAAAGTSLSVGGAGEHWRHGHGGPTPNIVDGSSITLAVLGKSSVDLNGSDDTVALANGSSLTIMGANDAVSLSKGDTVVAGLDDQIDDLGSSNFIEVDGAVGALKIAGFGSDAMGVVSLGAGVGGFANVSAIVAALTSDGNGGTLLSLGADGSIDFAGVALSALGASHFAIA